MAFSADYPIRQGTGRVQLIRSRADAELPLHDGSVVSIRDATAADAVDVRRFMENLSPSSRYLRFLMAIREFPECVTL